MKFSKPCLFSLSIDKTSILVLMIPHFAEYCYLLECFLSSENKMQSVANFKGFLSFKTDVSQSFYKGKKTSTKPKNVKKSKCLSTSLLIKRDNRWVTENTKRDKTKKIINETIRELKENSWHESSRAQLPLTVK